jgi:hypothetical protein
MRISQLVRLHASLDVPETFDPHMIDAATNDNHRLH